jgi:transcriptional regulator with XRE-family HTH domain
MKVPTKNCRSFGVAEMNMAHRVKQLRHEKGLSLAELAKASNLSSGFLSRVENHKISLPIASLERVAAALSVPIKYFFEDESERVLISVSRRGEGSKGRIRGKHGFEFESLVPDKKGKLMEPIIVNLSSATAEIEPKAHSGEEFDFVLEGECELRYGKQTILLKTGDSAYFDATVPHVARAAGDKPCRILAVLVTRDYLFHGDLTSLLRAE